jgi:hypothetical protein
MFQTLPAGSQFTNPGHSGRARTFRDDPRSKSKRHPYYSTSHGLSFRPHSSVLRYLELTEQQADMDFAIAHSAIDSGPPSPLYCEKTELEVHDQRVAFKHG